MDNTVLNQLQQGFMEIMMVFGGFSAEKQSQTNPIYILPPRKPSSQSQKKYNQYITSQRSLRSRRLITLSWCLFVLIRGYVEKTNPIQSLPWAESNGPITNDGSDTEWIPAFAAP